MIADAARQLGCRSVAFTYNDPVIFLEYAVDTARACHEAGLKTVAVTAGYITPEARGEFYAHIDAANVDLKGFTEPFYRNLCGGRLADVLDTLVWIRPHGCLARGHHAADPRRERFRCRDRRALGLVRRRTRPRRAAALHRLPSRLAHARPSADAARDADPRAGDRDEPRAALRLHRQRA